MDTKGQIVEWIAGRELPQWPFGDLKEFETEWGEWIGEGWINDGIQTMGEWLILRCHDQSVRIKVLVDTKTKGVNVLTTQTEYNDKKDI